MAAPYTSVRRKTEDAIMQLVVAYADGGVDSLQQVKGFSGSDLTTPRLEVICDRAEPEIIGNLHTGNYTVSGHAAVVTTYADSGSGDRASHGQLMAYVEDVLTLDPRQIVQLIKALNQVDYTAQWFYIGEGRDETNGTSHRSVVDFQVYCCPSDVLIPTSAASYVPEG